jgi:hypothetical protein
VLPAALRRQPVQHVPVVLLPGALSDRAAAPCRRAR